MVVLSIIGIIIGLILIAFFIQYSNAYSTRVYEYEIFNITNFVMSVLGYIAIYFGNEWYTQALKAHEDILNGELLIGIGTLLLYGVLYINIKRTAPFYGFLMSIVGGVLYLAATPLVFFAFLMALAYFSETKPVYTIND